jgi:hypothetical protein
VHITSSITLYIHTTDLAEVDLPAAIRLSSCSYSFHVPPRPGTSITAGPQVPNLVPYPVNGVSISYTL